MFAAVARGPGRRGLAVATLIATLSATAFVNGAGAHATRVAHDPASARSVLQSGRWMTLRGKRVWAVALTLRTSGGRIKAHAASTDYHKNLGSGLCMSSWPNVQGQPVTQQICNHSYNQTWYYATGADAQGYLSSIGSGSLCLNNFGGGFSNGNVQALWSCDSTSTAMWYGAGISHYSGYELVHLNDYIGHWSRMCLSSLGDTTPGSHIVEWTCNTYAANQGFNGAWWINH